MKYQKINQFLNSKLMRAIELIFGVGTLCFMAVASIFGITLLMAPYLIATIGVAVAAGFLVSILDTSNKEKRLKEAIKILEDHITDLEKMKDQVDTDCEWMIIWKFISIYFSFRKGTNKISFGLIFPLEEIEITLL